MLPILFYSSNFRGRLVQVKYLSEKQNGPDFESWPKQNTQPFFPSENLSSII